MGTMNFSWHAWRTGKEFGFWVRIFGYGFSIGNAKPLFSERNGFRNTLRIFGVKFELLKPRDLI